MLQPAMRLPAQPVQPQASRASLRAGLVLLPPAPHGLFCSDSGAMRPRNLGGACQGAPHGWPCSKKALRHAGCRAAAVALLSGATWRWRARPHRRLPRFSRQALGRDPRFWRTLDPRRWTSGLQDPATVRLPSGVQRGDPPQHFAITEEQVHTFERDGVVLIRGVLCDWMDFLQQASLHQMENPQVSAILTSLRTFFSMDYIQAGLFLTNSRFHDFWHHSPLGHVAAQAMRAEEVRLVVDQLNVNPHCPMFTEVDKFHTDVGVTSALARKTDVLRCWIPLEKAREQGRGTLEFIVGDDGERRRFEQVEPGDVLLFSTSIPHRVLFPPEGNYGGHDRCVVIASLHATRSSSSAEDNPMALAEFPRIYPESIASEVAARNEQRLYSTLQQYLRLWGSPSALLDEWLQFITYNEADHVEKT
eukprot:TRINITY_DN59045_c0_g1_i1.p1 TRINITY_DN59045_c0_g1~~TRINITY_DN59045_c0_g1_i1.p1  ORF type:complete len:418 (+),score=58.63 TRINITY_DN59045_c0_g1_i1:14-1267(+)